MSKSNDFFSDDLSDLIGNGASAQPLPQDPQLARIRAEVPEFQETCLKCHGTGQFRGYSGRVLGQCFACKGRGQNTFKTSPEARAKAREDYASQPAKRWAAFGEAHPVERDWILANPSFEFAANMKIAIEKYGELTEKQMFAVQRCVARSKERAASKVQQAAQQQERVQGINVANIVDAFQRAQQAGLKRFTLRFVGANFQVDKNDPTLIWVSEGGYGTAKYGRITGGVFRPGRDATDEVLARIAEISKDPLAAGVAYAQLTSSCSVCGRHLENQDSVDAGIGPVCAGRLNRPGIKMVPVSEF